MHHERYTKELIRKMKNRTIRGLNDEELNKLVEKSHTVMLIEHNMDIIKCADWVIDLGPEGGDAGGEVVIAGTPEEVAACEKSETGKFLKKVLT
jgi:excinuclease ABC subunit A